MGPGRYLVTECMGNWWITDSEMDNRVMAMLTREDEAQLVADALNHYEPSRTRSSSNKGSSGPTAAGGYADSAGCAPRSCPGDSKDFAGQPGRKEG